MKVKISGVYRHEAMHHTEQGLKDYDISFDADPKKETPKTILEKAAALIRLNDSDFDSFKTHKIEWVPDASKSSKSITDPGVKFGAGIN
jgi:hypothetical protein